MKAGQARSSLRKRPPVLPRRVHFLGICGRMVGGVALALRELGVRVSGTDGYQYSPMPEILRAAGIKVNKAWSADHLASRLDAVVTGALVWRGNPELEAALDSGVPVMNCTAFLQRYFLARSENYVVAGTKGKTTTTAMLAWILEHAKLAPDYLIGGQVRGAMLRVRLTGAPLAVLEGDEYCCGGGDPLPKFLRYHPRHVLITNVAHDHLERFPVERLYREAFMELINHVPRKGSLTINADDPGAMTLPPMAHTQVRTVGFANKADFRLTRFRESADGILFRVKDVEFKLGLPGRVHARAAALASVAALRAGVSLPRSAKALRSFPGVEGRMEKISGEGRVTIYSDDAYLPMAIGPLLDAVRKRHPRQRIVFLFEPRYTCGRDSLFQRDLPASLAVADEVLVCPAIEIMRIEKPFDHKRLCRDLRKRGVRARALASAEEVTRQAPQVCRDGDVLVISLSLIRGELVKEAVRALREKDAIPSPA